MAKEGSVLLKGHHLLDDLDFRLASGMSAIGTKRTLSHAPQYPRNALSTKLATLSVRWRRFWMRGSIFLACGDPSLCACLTDLDFDGLGDCCAAVIGWPGLRIS